MPELLRLNDGYVDLRRCCVVRQDRDEAPLTPIEQRLLAFLASRPGEAVGLDELTHQVWDLPVGARSRAPYVAIQRLRTKLEVDPADPQHLVAVRGTGYRLDLCGEPEARPTVAAVAGTAFFGRVDERTAVAAAWSAGGRLLTLHGPGGAGKTRLAREHLAADAPGLGAPATLVLLAEATDTGDLLGAVAGALRIPLVAGRDDDRHLERIGRVLRSLGPHLLVLDNVEQIVAPAAAAVPRWLDLAPELRILVTSRHPLGVAAERVVPVRALDPDSAVALMLDRARRVRWGYTPAPEDAALLRDLACRDLDGMPLAIELAAARLATMEPAGLVARLRDRLRILSGGRGEARWTSLQAALEWSWELLSDVERRALAQASVFAGGFDLDAAEAVLDVGDAWCGDVLTRLVDHALLQVEAGRFQLLESVRALGAARLGAAGREVRARHRRWVQGLPVPRHEWDNLRAAHASALADGDAGGAVALVEALDAIALRYGPLLERVPRLEATLAALPDDHPGRVGPMWRLGDALRMLERYSDARRILEEAVEVGRGVGRVAEPLTALLAVLASQLDLDDYRRRVDEALDIVRSEGDTRRECILVHNLSILEREGDVPRSDALSHEALALARRIDDVPMQVQILTSMATTAGGAGRLDEALDRLGQAMTLARVHELDALRPTLFVNLAHLHVRRGDPERSDETYAEALALARRIGDERVERLVHHGRATLALDRGDLEAALQATRALEQAQAHSEDSVGAATTLLLGVVLRARGDLAGAERELRSAYRTARERGAAHLAGHAGVHLAAALADAGDLDGSDRLVADLRAQGRQARDEGLLQLLTVVDAQLLRARGQPSEADGLLAALPDSDQDVQRLVRLMGSPR